MGAKGIARGHEVVDDRHGEGEERERERKRVGTPRWWGTVRVCGRVQERGGEATATAGRERRGESEQTTGKKSAASKAAPPRLNFRIYRTKIVV